MPEKKSTFKRTLIILTLSLALAIIILDSTILNVSFSYILKDLDTDIKSLQWVITAYSLVIAALTVTGGRLGDIFGRKKMFIIGAVLFAIGSFITSISTSVNMMIVGESVIEGVGAALMMPATASLLASSFQGPARATAFGVWGGVAGASSAIGPVLGGYLTSQYSWRWAFRINIFVVALLILGSFIIKEYRDENKNPELDFLGIILSSLGLFSLVFGIIESSTYGWIRAKEVFEVAGRTIDLGSTSIVVPALIIAAILLIAFGIWESYWEGKGHVPIVSMGIFKNRQFSSGVLTVMLMALGQAGMLFAIPIFFQAVRGLDALHTGLAIAPASITALFVAPFAGMMIKRISPKRLIQLGILGIMGGMVIMYYTLNTSATPIDFLPAMIVYGLGIGLMMAQINNVIMSSVSVEKAGEVSGINNTMRQIGMTMGSAIIGAVLLTALSTNLSNNVEASTKIPKNVKPRLEEQIASHSDSIEFYGAASIPELPPAISGEVTSIINESTTEANKQALLYAVGFLSISFFASFLLPGKKQIMESMSGKGASLER